MTAPTATLSLRVVQAQPLNPLIRMLRLRAEDGRALPGFAAGAHIRVQVSLPDGKTDWRHYSLINFGTARNATTRRRNTSLPCARRPKAAAARASCMSS